VESGETAKRTVIVNQEILVTFVNQEILVTFVNQEIFCHSWNPDVWCHIHESFPLHPFLGWINPIHNHPSCILISKSSYPLIYAKFFKMDTYFQIFLVNILYTFYFSRVQHVPTISPLLPILSI